MPVELGGRTVPVDVAFGGAFYAIVDAEAAGLAVDAARLAELRAPAWPSSTKSSACGKSSIRPNPDSGHLRHDLHGAAAPDGAHLRNVTIFADAEVDRSPCGTGTAAVMAVLDAMGVLGDDAPFVHESIIGTSSAAGRRPHPRRRSPRDRARDPGSAWITGEHTFLVDGDDPLVAASASERRHGATAEDVTRR